MKISTVLLAILVVAIWGINPTVSKFGMLGVPTFTFLSLRYFLTALLFLPFARVRKDEWAPLFIFALFHNVIMNGLCYAAFQYLQPAAATLLLQMGAPVSILMACLFAKEKISPRQILGLSLAIGGVVMILGMPEISLLGAILILTSHVFWGGCQLIFKSCKNFQSSALIAYSALFALPFAVCISMIFEPNGRTALTEAGNFAFGKVMIFQVLGLSCAMVMWQRLVAANGINKINPFTMLEIAFSILAGYVVFGDKINWNIAAGIVMISLGVLLAAKEAKVND